MEDALGEMYLRLPNRHLWRRITKQEGWEKGLFRAIDLHEETGCPVLVSVYVNGSYVSQPKLEITTRKGQLCLVCVRAEQEGAAF